MKLNPAQIDMVEALRQLANRDITEEERTPAISQARRGQIDKIAKGLCGLSVDELAELMIKVTPTFSNDKVNRVLGMVRREASKRRPTPAWETREKNRRLARAMHPLLMAPPFHFSSELADRSIARILDVHTRTVQRYRHDKTSEK